LDILRQHLTPPTYAAARVPPPVNPPTTTPTTDVPPTAAANDSNQPQSSANIPSASNIDVDPNVIRFRFRSFEEELEQVDDAPMSANIVNDENDDIHEQNDLNEPWSFFLDVGDENGPSFDGE